MPQMAPLSWLILFLIFTITFLVFNTINYTITKYSPKIMSLKSVYTKINWKW
uniref:ATP synthase complex subunit 8 n=1 Tax=Anobiinae sp. BMNH 1274383 TaxID=1796498 RepID=A0A140EFV0_9COLE|nr:ATP synthase F0 subunit 8 [Anobiinae sp. BMNH 1274383]